MIDKRNIGKKLKELRLSRGWRQAELSEKVGLSRPAICNIEAGKRSITLSTLQKFCEVYSIDISYFDIETNNYDEAIDLTTRLERIFNSDEVDKETKDELYTSIMEIYLKSKKNDIEYHFDTLCH